MLPDSCYCSAAAMTISMENRSIDEPRPIKVITIGAGISGIIAGIRFPQRIPNLDLVIYDKNPEVSGTWYENRYPGVACDIPAHSYQLTFEPNPNWSQFYASGHEIFEYWKGVCHKYGVDKYIKLNHKILSARYDEPSAKWHVLVQNLISGETFEDVGDILYMCVGALNEWKWPSISGLHDFKGDLMHSAHWDDSWDATGKSIAVIGSGSSAIQIVPSLQPKVKSLDNYVRGKTWISSPFAPQEVEKHTSTEANFTFSDEELKHFKNDPEFFLKYRKMIEQELQSVHHITFRGQSSQEAADAFKAGMRAKLATKPEIFEKLLPSFPPGCRRLTPGPGYLSSLTKDNVSFISDEIDCIVPTGIVTKDGTLREVDAIICATGFDTTYTGRFPVIGRNGTNLTDKWAKYPETYLSMTTDGFPNMFMSLGPNSAIGSGSLSIMLEYIGDYVSYAIRKMQRENLKSMEIKKRCVKNFVNFCTDYFKDTVFSLPCRSWYKGGTSNGRISALWPGSSLHAITAFGNPRWEDYDYEFVHGNEMGWFGNGWSHRERIAGADLAFYLDPAKIDYPPVAAVESAKKI
ncbi:uncharacterized protein V1518DRAFT_414073 [Limtongia smithiae]|uniref:uncharacterized protein n=1 Tax=Limtongia smithiae TaxID=1125753 RepID=UPI0034CDE400